MNEEQLKRLDRCHFEYSMGQRCVEELVPARQLLGSSRFDLYAILLYIDHRVRGVKDMSYARNVYKERTRAITGFKFSELGNGGKNSLNDFYSVLDHLIDDFQNDRYDEELKLIPVDKDYELIDGAHRVSCAAYFNKNVRVLRFLDHKVTRMTSQDLMNKLMPIPAADAMALESIRWHDDLFMLFLWPKSFDQVDKLSEAKELIYQKMDVVYEKNDRMTFMGIRNLMVQIYGNMPWVGNIDNDFDSTYKKTEEVWAPHGKCSFILVKAPSMEYVLDIIAQVRDIFQMGLASIHSTGNMRETGLAVNAIFNPNSFHFVNRADPTRYKQSYRILEDFRNKINEAGVSLEDFIVDSSMVLSIYGAREANDLDYYSMNDYTNIFKENSKIEEHNDKQKSYYDITVEDLIRVPSNYFMFNEIKFVSLERLLAFKQNRYNVVHDAKDSADIKIIKMLMSDKESKMTLRWMAMILAYKRQKRLFSIWYHEARKTILERLGMYNILRNIYRKMK